MGRTRSRRKRFSWGFNSHDVQRSMRKLGFAPRTRLAANHRHDDDTLLRQVRYRLRGLTDYANSHKVSENTRHNLIMEINELFNRGYVLFDIHEYIRIMEEIESE